MADFSKMDDEELFKIITADKNEESVEYKAAAEIIARNKDLRRKLRRMGLGLASISEGILPANSFAARVLDDVLGDNVFGTLEGNMRSMTAEEAEGLKRAILLHRSARKSKRREL